MASCLMQENVWLQQQKFEDAERLYRQIQAGTGQTGQTTTSNSLAGELSQMRQDIQNALSKQPTVKGKGGADPSVTKRLEALEKENKELRKITDELRALLLNVQASVKGTSAAPNLAVQKPTGPPPAEDDDDDDEDLFGSDDEETKALKEKRLKEYSEKKAKKPGPIAKSSIVLDVKPWDDETDMGEVEKRVRSIQQDGLVWGASKLTEVGYGIKKLTIICVVEDDKVGVDDLTEKITDDNEDLVQSVDIAAFNKI